MTDINLDVDEGTDPPAMPACYASPDEAADYFRWSLNSAAWDEASNDDRCKALVSATRLIDRLNFAGLRTSDYHRFRMSGAECGYVMGPMTLDPAADSPPPGQPLEFPRNGSDTIPGDIVAACCETALALLDGFDPEMEMRGLANVSTRFSSAHASVDPAAARMALRHGLPYVAWNLLSPYLADPSEISRVRVS
jgi:hypothetical protein